MAATAGGVFDREQEEAIVQRLHQPPGEEARQEAGAPARRVPPSRWTLRRIRASVPVVATYSLSGVWRVVHRARLGLRTARLQLYSPDPQYLPKVARLERCRREAARAPEAVALVFVDEMGSSRWPEAAPDWMLAAPDAPTLARRAGPTNRQQRLIAALNALTGQVDYLDNYLVGRQQVIAFYQQLDRTYAGVERVYLVQDHWSIHQHDDVQAVLAGLPRLGPGWLPTLAPRLQPIRKVWPLLGPGVPNVDRLARQLRH